VTSENGVRVRPYVKEKHSAERFVLRPCSVESMVHGHVAGLEDRDRVIARALWTASPSYYGYTPPPSEGEARAQVFRALTLLEGYDGVRGSGSDVPLRVRSGQLGVTLARDDEGWRFVFELAGEPLEAPQVRAALDASGQGHVIHVDPARGVVLLARLGERTSSVLAAIVSEAALFPDDLAHALAERLASLGDLVPVVLPEALAGEAVTSDARPVVRMEREAVDAFALTWLVRPIPGGRTFAPGKGSVQVLEQLGGRRVFAVRELDEELRQLDALRALLPASTAHNTPASAHCRGMDTVLLVIERLRAAAAAGDLTVEWPRTLPRVVGSASWSKLHLRITAGRDWFGMDGSVAVDDVTLTLAELLAARRRGDRYVAVGPDKLVTLEDDLRDRLEEVDTIGRSSKTGLAIAPAAVPALAELVASRDQIDAVPAFWTLLARVDAARASEPKVPRGFAKVLRSYQVEGFRWMSRLAAWSAGACLADEMGLGKTVQALALLVARSKAGPALVVAPTSVGPNWMNEAKRFAPSLGRILYRGAGREAALAALGPGDLLVTSYDLLARDAEQLSRIEFATVILDEAQAVKNGSTTRARAARSLRAEFRLALTGTPVENRLAELYSLMEFLNPGFFGTEEEFRARYVVPIERDKDPARSAALARAVRPFLLRRRKAEVLSELPARTEVTRAIERTPTERRLYEAARQLAIEALSGADEDARFRVLAEIMRLRRLACHPRLDDDASTVPSSKLDAFLALATELREGGHRALVFSQFTGHLALVEEALRAHSIPYLYLDGKTPLVERTRRVAAFQAGETDLFLISLKAGGTGLNLTGADTVIHLDPWWNPAVEDQATDRAHRIGQTRPVTVVRLIAQGTIEEAVLALHADKRELAESILEGTAASGKLSIAELGALIRAGVTG
jgi:superfamily II DNA or RNA helicase